MGDACAFCGCPAVDGEAHLLRTRCEVWRADLAAKNERLRVTHFEFDEHGFCYAHGREQCVECLEREVDEWKRRCRMLLGATESLREAVTWNETMEDEATRRGDAADPLIREVRAALGEGER